MAVDTLELKVLEVVEDGVGVGDDCRGEEVVGSFEVGCCYGGGECV